MLSPAPPHMHSPDPMTALGFAEVAHVSRETTARLETYLALLTRWQKSVNLVGRSTLADPWRRHIWDSAQLHPLIPTGATVVDLGSGAGFPGLVLAILGGPRVRLVEADQRKAAFLREAARLTETDVDVDVGRAEALDPITADVVTARALASVAELVNLAWRWLKPGGFCLFLKGRQADDELAVAHRHWNFSVERIASRSEAGATILRLGDIARV
jgi:16S rRNA (guanine527-N7)-methyltransferase